MRTIDIDEDIYEHIATNTKEIGETASDILRRLLNLNSTNGKTSPLNELSEILEDPSLKFATVVERYLIILGTAYKKKPEQFDKILTIKGRDRKYFGTSAGEINSSGRKTFPKKIYHAPYWAMTNSSTAQKAQLIKQALVVIGFNEETAQAASRLMR